jgi:uncharacterized protein YodC (DUF2158 family)
METFKLGDVVKLKSGSPEMVIEQMIESDRVTCVWLNDKQSQEIGSFNTCTLELLKAKKS